MSADVPSVVIGNDMPPELFVDVAATLQSMGVAVRTNGAADGDRAPRIIVVLSPKGGSGKTAVAANLSTALAERHPGRVVAVDLDLQFGDLGLALSVAPERTLAQLVRTGGIDSTAVKLHLTPTAHDLFVLTGAAGPVEAEAVGHDHIAQLLPMLARDFDYVIVDTPAGLDERTLAAVENASDLLMVSSLDVTSIRSLRTAVEALDQIGVGGERKLLLNRAGSKVGLESADAEDVLEMEIASTIPSTRDVPLSLNLGTPVVANQPRSAVAKQFRKLAELYAPVEAGKKSRGWRG